MMHKTYKTSGTCSAFIDFDIDDNGDIRNLKFTGGCSGNTQGLEKLCEGQKAEDVMLRLKGILCKQKGTSCPDQLSQAIAEALESK
jgi:uncharacterized protein (TIGR03905 family)